MRGVGGAIGLRDYFGPPQRSNESLSQEALRKMEQQMEERFNQRMGIMEQRFMEQLQQQQQIQRTLEEKLQSMQQQNMELPTQAPTGQRVSTKGSCSGVDHTDYTSQYELLVDEDPPRVVAIGRQLQGGETIHGVPLLPHHVRVMIDEVRDPHAQVPVPTSEIQFVGEALGTFIAWPKALIMPYFSPPKVL